MNWANFQVFLCPSRCVAVPTVGEKSRRDRSDSGVGSGPEGCSGCAGDVSTRAPHGFVSFWFLRAVMRGYWILRTPPPSRGGVFPRWSSSSKQAVIGLTLVSTLCGLGLQSFLFWMTGRSPARPKQSNCSSILSNASSSRVGLKSFATKPRWFLLALL